MMKKVDLLPMVFAILLVFCGKLCVAQTLVGLSGGGGFTQSTGFRFALPVEHQLSKHISLFSGLAFIQRRNREFVRKLSAGREYLSAEADYLSLPVLFKVRLDWEPVRIYGLAGIEINYGLRIQATGVEDQRLFKEKLGFKSIGISHFDGGFCVGAGFETDLRRNRKIFADLRYYLGILDIDESKVGEIYNEGAFVTLGFLLPI